MASRAIDSSAALSTLLGSRLSDQASAFKRSALSEMGQGVTSQRLAQLLALASRHVRAGVPLHPVHDELRALDASGFGCDPSRWGLLETLRIALLLAWPDPDSEDFHTAYEHCFLYADLGESCALYRALPLLPHGERFVWRAGEGCRSNVRVLFEAVACDSPYPACHFDDTAWHQLVIKAVFVDAPLWRVHGLDARLSPELARMALDLADERRSAGRSVPPQLWCCLGPYAGVRGVRALQQELAEPAHGDTAHQRGALLALARADALNDGHQDVAAAMEAQATFIEQARAEGFTQRTFRLLDEHERSCP